MKQDIVYMKREADIVYENEKAWVCRDRKRARYTVFIKTLMHSYSDSSYSLSDDGLSLAKARATYIGNKT
jgi:hypothetical protein